MDDIIKDFFYYADKVIQSKNKELMIELKEITDLKYYKEQLKVIYSFIKESNYMKYCVENQLESFFVPQLVEVKKFIEMCKEKYPEEKEDEKELEDFELDF